MRKKLFILALCVIAQGCSKIDDYMLGKDNTPQPKALTDIQSKVQLSSIWSVGVGKSQKSNEYLRLKPVLSHGVIYTANASGQVSAVKARTGEIIWNTQLKHGLVSGPTLSNGYLALGTNSSSLVVLDQGTGKQIWHRKVSGEILSPPVLAGNKLIIKTIDGKVYAFNKTDGKEIWVSEHGSPGLMLKASSAPVVHGNMVLVGFSDGKMDALDLANGRLIWQRSIAYAQGASDVERLVDIDSDPITSGNIVYLASYQGYIGAMALEDGQFIWRMPGSVYKNMLLNGNNLFISDTHDVLWSINKQSGQVNWKRKNLKARGLTEPVLIGGNLIVGDKTGYLHVIDQQNGEMLGRYKASGGISTPPIASGNKLYILTDNGMLNELKVN